MAASGALIARAAFTAHLAMLGVASAVGMTALALLTWGHGRAILRAELADVFPHHVAGTFGLLTAATLVTSVIAIVVTVAL